MYYINDNEITENKIENYESTTSYENAISILKRRKETQILNSYQNEVDNRFSSNAINTIKWYDSKEIDRNSLIGVVATNQDSYYKCFSTQTEIDGQWVLHTIEQLKNVLNDGRLLMIQLIQKRDSLISQIKNAETEEQIISINW